MSEPKVTCKNCGHTFTLNYCNNCGQTADTHRITWKEVWHHLPHGVLHIDGGFFYTIKELALRPGDSIREYLAGKRHAHFNPVLMLVLLSGAASYVYVHFHLETLIASVPLYKLEESNRFLVHKFFAIRTLLFCIVFSFLDYGVFWDRKLTLPELITANIFMFCGLDFLQLALSPLLVIGHATGHNLLSECILLGLAYFYLLWARVRFFRPEGKIGGWIRIVVSLAAYFVFILLAADQVIRPLFSGI